MSNVLWTDGALKALPEETFPEDFAVRLCVATHGEDLDYPLTPRECDALAVALTQAAAMKRSRDLLKKLDNETKETK